tara:strand:- start:1124 stop:1519 length:396 start_codon:yes stop_codon:yes gene_type:complete
MNVEAPEVESKIAPPLVNCAQCGGMLPQGLGEIECILCGALCRVSHKPTLDALREEKVQCPLCLTAVEAGTDQRPVELTCGSCSGSFTLKRKFAKVEIQCPACEANLRIRPRPGKRELTCPGCQNPFNVTF